MQPRSRKISRPSLRVAAISVTISFDVALLAAGLDVLLVMQRPQPVLVVAVRLFDAGERHAVAAMAGRAAEAVGIVDLEQLLARDGW